ncbi:MAG: hypothetical protein JNG90_17780, partial [Planctomycetaceae bacterium]|nr:hypothetical protein [Planctomycetaceae bacterium]
MGRYGCQFALLLAVGAGACAAARGALAEPSAPPARPAAAATLSSRELLELYGVDESYFRSLIDGRPLHDDESEALLRTVFTLRRLRALDLFRAERSAAALGAVLADPAAHRGQLVRLAGQATGVTALTPLPELIERFELPRYYRCELELADPPHKAILYTATIPRSWPGGFTAPQPVAAWGFFLKDEGGGATPLPVFVAPRLEWHPNTPLGRLGVDVSLLDELRQRQRLTGEDREAFYAVLDAVGRAPAVGAADSAPTPVTAEFAQRLFADPATLVGANLWLDGVVRRAVRIRVNDPDVIERYGIDHYYELEIFVDVPRLAAPHNPLIHVVCVRSVPEGFPLGENLNVAARVHAYFLKLWSYRSKLAEQSGEGFRQVAPLCLGREPTLAAPPEDRRNFLGSVATAILAGIVLLAVLVAWRSRREDARTRRNLRHDELPLDLGS